MANEELRDYERSRHRSKSGGWRKASRSSPGLHECGFVGAVWADLTRAQGSYDGRGRVRVGGSGEFGVVRPGARADFVLAKGNPLEDVKNASHIVGVMVRGHWLLKEARPRDLDATQ
jgi:hypothetical protein